MRFNGELSTLWIWNLKIDGIKDAQAINKTLTVNLASNVIVVLYYLR